MFGLIRDEIAVSLTPFKNLSYYHNFFKLISNVKTPWKVKMYLFIFVLKIINKIILLFSPNSEYSQILLLNYMYLFKLPNDSKAVVVNIYTQTIINYCIMYIFSFNSDFTKLPCDLISKNNLSSFLTPFYNKKNICTYFQKYSFILLNMFQTFVIASGYILTESIAAISKLLLLLFFLDFIFVTTQIVVVKFIKKYYRCLFSTFLGFLGLCQLEAHLLLSSYYLCEAANVCALMLAMMLICEKINFVQQQQANSLLVQCTRSFAANKHIAVNLNKYFHYHTKCCLSMLSINKVQGIVLLNCIISNTPTSAYLIILTLQSQFINASQIVFALLIMAGQTGCLFGIHYMILSYSSRVHSCCPHLIKLYTCNMHKKRFNLKMQFKLANYYQKFCTKNRYSITYGPICPATFKTFSRVS